MLIDFFGRRRPFFDDWGRLLAMRELGDADLWVSSLSFADAFHVLRKPVGSERLQEAFSESLEFLHVCAVGPDEIAQASQRSWPDFEDCLISVCAERVGADFLLTRDKTGFARGAVPALSPAALFDRLEKEHGIAYDDV